MCRLSLLFDRRLHENRVIYHIVFELRNAIYCSSCIERRNLIAALGRYRQDHHNGIDFDVACETEIKIRAVEAIWLSVMSPKMNNRNECLVITSNLMTFVSLCDLQIRL